MSRANESGNQKEGCANTDIYPIPAHRIFCSISLPRYTQNRWLLYMRALHNVFNMLTVYVILFENFKNQIFS